MRESGAIMKTELLLDGKGIDIACEEAADFLAGTGMSKREMIAGRLSFENVLLNYADYQRVLAGEVTVG